MRNLIFISICMLFSTVLMAQDMPTIHASDKMVDIRDGKNLKSNYWTISPEYNPDVYKTTVTEEKEIVYYTNLDSISFTVKPGDSYDFVIMLNKTDSCIQRVEAIEGPNYPDFPQAYKDANKGKYSMEVPEVQELVHIIIALTKTGLADSNLVNHEGEYYQDVINHFGPYKEEQIVQLLDNGLVNNYPNIKASACQMSWDGDRIVNDPNYGHLYLIEQNQLAQAIPLLEDFAKKTQFRQFYQDHKEYYEKLIALMHEQTPIKQQWEWLEKEFPHRYHHYRVTFSPLVYGSHSTTRFGTEDFLQTMMLICGPYESEKYSEAVKEGFMTRVVFTEIDHNYVNPTSDEYTEEIDQIFDDREKWTKVGSWSDSYGTPYMVFNEYMTWGVFALYADDFFEGEDLDIINERMITQMEKWRGFTKFGDFTRELLKQYKNKKEGTLVSDLYPSMLEWCAEQ